jgi:hypothetical protein
MRLVPPGAVPCGFGTFERSKRGRDQAARVIVDPRASDGALVQVRSMVGAAIQL